MLPRGQGAFVAVTLTVAAVALLLYFFPDGPESEDPPPRLGAQVIRPAARGRQSQAGGRSRSTARRSPRSQILDEIWQVIYVGKARIGYSRTVFERVTRGNAIRIRSTTEMHLTVKRFGQTTTTSTQTRTVETASGDLVSFEATSGSGGQKTTMTGRRDGDYLLVETTQSGTTRRRYVEWRAGIKSPMYLDRLVRTWPMKPGEIRRFKTFVPELGRVTEVRLAADGYRPRRLRDGRVHKLLRVRVTRSLSPTETVYSWLDKKGRPVLVESEFAGETMAHYIVSKAEALKAIQGAELDLGLKSVIYTTPLRDLRQQKQVVYRIAMAGDDPAKYVVADKRQKIRRLDARTIELTVGRLRLPRRLVHVRTDRKYLNSSRYLESNDVRVREHARRAAGYETRDVQIALKMERYVHETLKDRNFSTSLGTAAAVARSLSGDCTEHAVLLAAMLRVRRIPSRVAVGLVYDPRMPGFVAHMWTEARLGEDWFPLDGTRGQGGVGPAHIKLADASFSDKSDDPITAFVPLMNVLGKWRIEVRNPARAAPSRPPSLRVPSRFGPRR